ncbi:hypothetical protein [Helicobacter pylori]|uniref:hypothetical protein n=1 Tax=Helicobacter pylori TaxID=210 RepID=UPI0007DB219B|nr:hypothetical protein [Helicobacter pylori]
MIELDYLNDYTHKQKIKTLLSKKEEVEKLKEMHEKYQAEFYTNPEHLKNIAQRESGDKKEATQSKSNNGAVRLFQKDEATPTQNEIKDEATQSGANNGATQSGDNNGATLFDNLNVSNDTKRIFNKINEIRNSKKQS